MTTKDVLALALEALLDCARKAEALKKECGMDPESPQAIRNSQYMAISYTAHAAITAIKQAQEPVSDAALIAALKSCIADVLATGSFSENAQLRMKNLLAAAPKQAQEPVAFISPKQLELIKDPEGKFGHYIPMRKTSAGNFVMALYAAPKQAEPQIHCPEKLKKGGCQLHNLHCGWPKCNSAPTPPEAK